MRALLIMDAGDGLLDLAIRSQDSGHQVKCFIRKFDPMTRPIGEGLIERVVEWRRWMEWADLVVLEGNGFSMADFGRYRQAGFPVIGGSSESAAWELDREIGMRVFDKAGIPVPEYRRFDDYETAIRFVERRGEPWFSKPCSDTADKSLSAKTGVPEDPTYILRKWKAKHGTPPCPFLLQKAISGVEFAVGAWHGPNGFAEGVEENFEHKRFCAGDLGPNTGEMGTVMRYVRRSKLFQQILAPLEETLGVIGYCGNVDVNCMVDRLGQAWPLEFTMRLGWPAFNLETDLFDCDPLDFFHALSSGESTKGAHRMDEIAVGVVVAIPPYPSPPRAYEDIVGIPIFGVDDEPGWHPCEVSAQTKAAKHPQHSHNARSQDNAPEEGDRSFVTAGHYVGIAVGTAPSVRQAAPRAYRVTKKISIPASPFWRNDIGRRLKTDLPKLQSHGFASGMDY